MTPRENGSKCYCGPWWSPKFINCWLSKPFNASCKVHDLDYESDKYSQLEADDRFKKNLTRQAKGSIIKRMLVPVYYWAVRLGGRASYGKREDSQD